MLRIVMTNYICTLYSELCTLKALLPLIEGILKCRPYLITFRALRSMVRATKIRNTTPLISCWVAES